MKSSNLADLSKEAMSTIELEDIRSAFGGRQKKKADLGINEKMLREAMEELNGLVGMNNIKTEVMNW